LEGVKIVDYQIDEEKKTCSATAVMPNGWVQPKCLSAASELFPADIREPGREAEDTGL
jgi:hypothetical protein